ncbi:MAG: hypothetical protein M0P39_04660 [Rhodocyclaceae bacterium]|jgi:hypothetical protein|nr:hypothetical protein [Rhodocyclaceae bacterium]
MKLTPLWRGFIAGAAIALGAAALGLIFVAYQQPGLLLQLVNLRYCG